MKLDADACYRALLAHDARFDGIWFVGVTSTGIYCRPVCRARTPRREHCEFLASAALAEQRGYRPCLRCRPELAPGHAWWGGASRLAADAAARIEAGALAEGTVAELAAEHGLGERQLRRVLRQELGVSPVELAQTHRLLLAKRLLVDTRLPMAEVAFAAGFSSVRRFNALFRERYRLQPGALRRDGGRALASAAGDHLRLRLSYRPPLDWPALLGYLGRRALPGVELVEAGCYRRAVSLGGKQGWVSVEAAAEGPALEVEVTSSLAPVLAPLLGRLRRLFDLDAEPARIAEGLGADPRLAASVAARPGLRVPGAFCGFELALRAVLGQQVSVRGATTLAGRFVAAFGEPCATPLPGLTHAGLAPSRLARQRLEAVAALGLPRARAEAVIHLARAAERGAPRLEPGGDPERAIQALTALPGLGEWTAQYIAMRALRWPDALPHTDLGLRKALGGATPRRVRELAEIWRPWRAYALMHLWESLPAAPARTPRRGGRAP